MATIKSSNQSSPLKKSTNTWGNPIYKEKLPEHDSRLAVEGRWLLERATVCEPYDFLKRHFYDEPSLPSTPKSSFGDLISEAEKGKAIPSRPPSSAGHSQTSEPLSDTSDQSLDAEDNRKDIPKAYCDAFTRLVWKDCILEKQMYDPLKHAINNCLYDTPTTTSSSYRCFNTSRKRSPVGQGTSLHATLAPDLIITPEYSRKNKASRTKQALNSISENIFTRSHISVEVKLDEAFDCAFNNLGRIEEPDIEKTLTDQKATLILQGLRYVILGQFTTLPYRYVFHVTITGSVLRIWKFSPTGIELTTPIKYIDDPTPFVKFLMLVKRCHVSGIGLDIGEGRMFQEAPNNIPNLDKKMNEMGDLYSKESKNEAWFKNLRSEPGYWLFQPDISSTRVSPLKEPYKKRIIVFRKPIYRVCSITTRATRCYLGVEESFLNESFASTSPMQRLQKMHTLKTAWQNSLRVHELSFNTAFTTRREENGRSKGPTRVAGVLAGGVIPDTTQRLARTMAFQLPPNCTTNVDTQEPLERIELSDDDDDEDNEDEEDDDPDKDYKFSDASIAYITKKRQPTMVFSSTSKTGVHPIGNSTRILALEKPEGQEKKNAPSTSSNVQESQQLECPTKELRWILFDQVGGRLDGARNVKEMVQILVDATNAHQDLYNEKIFHRDISPNNIMIDLTTGLSSDIKQPRRGLLIDLDMAKDEGGELEDLSKRGPERTGTLLYMSMALKARPKHSLWHEIESLNWVAVWSASSHVPSVLYSLEGGETMISNPAQILERIFPDPGPINPMGDVVSGKKEFLSPKSTFSIPACPSLEFAIEGLRIQFMGLYNFLENASFLDLCIDRFKKQVLKTADRGENTIPFDKSNSTSELVENAQRMIHNLKGFATPANDNGRSVQWKQYYNKAVALFEEAKTIQYPSHETFIQAFQPVLDTPEAVWQTKKYQPPDLGSAPTRTLVKNMKGSKRSYNEAEGQNESLPLPENAIGSVDNSIPTKKRTKR